MTKSKKWVKELNRHFSKEDIQMANCREPAHKIPHMTRSCGEEGTLLYCWLECKLVQPLWRTVWRFLKKLEIELPYDPAIPLLGTHTGVTRIEGDTCTPNVHHSTVYNSQDMEATYMSISRWMDNKVVVHIHNGILLSYKRSAFGSVLMKWMKLEPITQSEISQKEKHEYSVLTHIYGI